MAFLDPLQLQGITNNTGDSDPASIAEKERRLSEIILQLQKFREQLLSQQEQVSVKKSSYTFFKYKPTVHVNFVQHNRFKCRENSTIR